MTKRVLRVAAAAVGALLLGPAALAAATSSASVTADEGCRIRSTAHVDVEGNGAQVVEPALQGHPMIVLGAVRTDETHVRLLLGGGPPMTGVEATFVAQGFTITSVAGVRTGSDAGVVGTYGPLTQPIPAWAPPVVSADGAALTVVMPELPHDGALAVDVVVAATNGPVGVDAAVTGVWPGCVIVDPTVVPTPSGGATPTPGAPVLPEDPVAPPTSPAATVTPVEAAPSPAAPVLPAPGPAAAEPATVTVSAGAMPVPALVPGNAPARVVVPGVQPLSPVTAAAGVATQAGAAELPEAPAADDVAPAEVEQPAVLPSVSPLPTTPVPAVATSSATRSATTAPASASAPADVEQPPVVTEPEAAQVEVAPFIALGLVVVAGAGATLALAASRR